MTDGRSHSDSARPQASDVASVVAQPAPNLLHALQRPPPVSSIRLDAENTAITFTVRWLGAITVHGRFTELEGTLHIPDGCVEEAEVAVNVAAASIRTGIALRDRHLRGPQFLDAARHPLIHFRSTRVERPGGIVVVNGLITLRGRDGAVSAVCPVAYADGSGDGARSNVQMSSAITVQRRDYGVGVAHGVQRANPLLYAIGTHVSVRVAVNVPASRLLPALLPALGR